MAKAVSGCKTVLRRTEGTIAHQATQQYLPLETREVLGDDVHNSVTDRKFLGLPPASRRPDLVVRSAREERTAAAVRAGHRDLQEVASGTVVEPVDDPLGHDCADLWIVREHLHRKLLSDDLTDSFLLTVRGPRLVTLPGVSG